MEQFGTNYEFKFKSFDEKLNLDNASIKHYPRIYFQDSLFDFFPYGEVYYKDSIGLITDLLIFKEGLELKTKLGTEKDGYIEGTYVWSESQVNNITMTNHISGDNAFILISKYYLDDKPQSRAWNDTVINIVKDITKKDFNITDNKKLFLTSSTSGVDSWYQYNIKSRQFLESILAKNAYHQTYNKSPFYTFINCNDEFYFMTLEEMFQQAPVADYTFELSQDIMLNPFSLKDYNVLMGGLPVNLEDYNKNICSTSESKQNEIIVSNIQDHIYKEKPSYKMIVDKEIQQKFKTYVNYGLYNSKKDKENRLGNINSYFQDSMLSYRLEGVIYTNPKVITGKIINLELTSLAQKEQLSPEFSGKWLVIKSEHHIDKDNMAFSKITLAKSCLQVNNTYSYLKNLV